MQGYACAAGIESAIGCHSFHASGITTYLERGGSLENAQRLTGHATPATTKLYVSIPMRTGSQSGLDDGGREMPKTPLSIYRPIPGN